jgi:hypothetical protein
MRAALFLALVTLTSVSAMPMRARRSMLHGGVKISKVSDKGAGGICDGKDFVELWNAGPDSVDLSNFTLADSKDWNDADAFTFPGGIVIAPAARLLGCKDVHGGDFVFAFGIGDGDTVSLYAPDKTVHHTVTMTQGMSGTEDWVWQLQPGGQWKYMAFEVLGSTVVISKVADKGSDGICDGKDFIEIWNAGNSDFDLWNLTLSDDKGPEDSDAFTFGKDSIIPPQNRLLGCKENDGGNFSFAFGIGGDDTVSLYAADLGLLDTKSIAGSSEATGWLWQRTADLGNWSYAPYQTGLLGSPPPPPPPKGGIFAYHELKCKTCHAMGLPYSVRTETCMAMGAWKDDVSGPFAVIWNGQVRDDFVWTSPYGAKYSPWDDCKRAALVAQEMAGEEFFNVNRYGGPPQSAGVPWHFSWPTGHAGGVYDSIMDIRITLSQQNLAYILANNSYETYVDVEELTVSGTNTENVTVKKMRMRPRGQSTMAIPSCMELPNIPFKLDFNEYNGSQTLFGMETAYLRNGLFDSSAGLREWSVHRMLQRFGLPYMRNRFVNVYINDRLIGLYNLMEAPDQEYVFARNFPKYDPLNYYLYKFKTMAANKCQFEESMLQSAKLTRRGCDDRKCTSTDGGEGYDCCASMDWGEPQTCVAGYQPVSLPSHCQYTCCPETPIDLSHEPYAFERGEHRELVDRFPLDDDKCVQEFFEMMARDIADAARAYQNYGYQCAEYLVEANLVD